MVLGKILLLLKKMIEIIPKYVQDFIDEYLNLDLGGKKIVTPYYLNPKSSRFGLRVLIGKGSPEEIVLETNIYAKLRELDLYAMDENNIRNFMQKIHIGIDCSGFVTHILNTWLKGQGQKPVWKSLQFRNRNIYRKVARFLRPIENINVETLTGDINSERIFNLNEVKVGDMIRLSGYERGNHIALIVEVEKENGNIKRMKYAHSTQWYQDRNGVKYGEIIIKNSGNDLRNQEWNENYMGKNWTYEQLIKNYEDNGIRRLRNVELKSRSFD